MSHHGIEQGTAHFSSVVASSGKENSNSSFPEDYTVKISDLQTVVSRLDKIVSVSYTHLDVYKRQIINSGYSTFCLIWVESVLLSRMMRIFTYPKKPITIRRL